MAIVLSGTTGIDAGSLPVANTGKISAGSGLPVILNTAGVDRITVDTAGNVGIGTSSPVVDAKLTIADATAPAIAFQRTNTGLFDTAVLCNNGSLIFKGGADSSTVAALNTLATLDNSGNLLLQSGTGGLGYGTGAGGTVTQLTSKSTAVTLNKPCGQITMNNAALAVGVSVTFILNNNLIGIGDNVYPSAYNNGSYRVETAYVANGSCVIRVTNVDTISRSEAVVLNFELIKGATA